MDPHLNWAQRRLGVCFWCSVSSYKVSLSVTLWLIAINFNDLR